MFSQSCMHSSPQQTSGTSAHQSSHGVADPVLTDVAPTPFVVEPLFVVVEPAAPAPSPPPPAGPSKTTLPPHASAKTAAEAIAIERKLFIFVIVPRRGQAGEMLKPPSTTIVWPVM